MSRLLTFVALCSLLLCKLCAPVRAQAPFTVVASIPLVTQPIGGSIFEVPHLGRIYVDASSTHTVTLTNPTSNPHTVSIRRVLFHGYSGTPDNHGITPQWSATNTTTVTTPGQTALIVVQLQSVTHGDFPAGFWTTNALTQVMKNSSVLVNKVSPHTGWVVQTDTGA